MPVRATMACICVWLRGSTCRCLDRPRRPDLLTCWPQHQQKRPTRWVGRVMQVVKRIQAAEGSTAQIWLSRLPELSVAP